MTDRTCVHGYLPYEHCSDCNADRNPLHFDAPSSESPSDTIARLTAELEAEKAKRAEAVDAETRACAEVVRSAIPNIPPDGPTNDECRIVYEELGGAMTAILARIDQRKEAGK